MKDDASPSLATLVSRGAVVNLFFGGFTDLLAAAQAVIVPRLLGPGNIGLFALAAGGAAIGGALKNIDLPAKIVQEREVDLHTSYGVAFTLELLLAGAFGVVVLGVAPVIAHLYHRPQLWLLISVMSAAIFTTAFVDLPAALPYRELRFFKRGVLTGVAPVVNFCVTIPLAYLGAGVWSLVGGTLAGFVAASIIMAVASPVRPKLMWQRGLVRRFLSFGWPLWLAGILGMASGWGAVFAVSSTIGVAGLGYFSLSQSWTSRIIEVDDILADTIFPAVCSFQSSIPRLRRAFETISRVSMLWASPVGFGVLVFASPAVNLLLGPRWHPAVVLLQASAAAILVESIGNSWNLFYAARGQTRPWLVLNCLGAAWIVVVVIPLLELFGINGAAMSVVVYAVGIYAARQYYVRRLLGPMVLAALVWREILTGAVAAAVIGAARALGWRSHNFVGFAIQILAFLAIAGAVVPLTSRALVGELIGALRLRRKPRGVPAERPAPSGVSATPRRMAFPLLAAADPDHGLVWVTTRDWPAIGRFDLEAEEWTWFPLPPFPHAPTPDGNGGCWTALTRSSAVAHVDADGATWLVHLEHTPELLVTALAQSAVWAVDSGRCRLWRIDVQTLEPASLSLPDAFQRPDFVAVDRHDQLWVGDTQTPMLARVESPTAAIEAVPVPHPTRCLLPDDRREGIWLGASDRNQLTLVGEDGGVLTAVELPAVPFGMAMTADGRIAAALKDVDLLALIDPDSGQVGGVRLPDASMPMGCAVVGDRCFVTLSGTSEIREIALVPPSAIVTEAGPSGGLGEGG